MCGNNVLELNRALIQEGLMLIFVEVLMSPKGAGFNKRSVFVLYDNKFTNFFTI